MAINQNHLFEDLNGVKCAIVEKNVPPGRVDFLRGILEYNRYTVIVVPSPPPKTAPAPPSSSATPPPPSSATPPPTAAPSAAPPPSSATPPPTAAPSAAPAPPPAATFTVGVTDVTFNPVNAIFGRLLHTPDGHVVTLAYWQQKEKQSNDAIPYFY
ncbi:MAG TPA: hypothetical protein VHE54_20005 [Puia sp.]|nr:hypothetical protein [Puia sp.]